MQTPGEDGFQPLTGDPAAAPAPNGRLLERDSDLARLHALVDALQSGRGHIVTVAGEAGIGKTSLIQAFRAQCGDRVLWAQGFCEALFTPRALGPIQDMAGFFGADGARILQNGTDRIELYSVLLKGLSELSKPAVIVWEDMHWADYATLDFLKFLGRRIALLNVLLVLSVRDDETAPDHPLQLALGELPSGTITRINLKPLSRDAVAHLAEREGLNPGQIFENSAGNPFFVTELLAAQRADASGIPVQVRDAVAARHFRLPETLRVQIEALSVVPGVIPEWLVRTLEHESGAGFVNEALARGILIASGSDGYRFRHELARLATLERIAPPQQRVYHMRILAALKAEGEEAHLDQIVHHAGSAYLADDVLTYAPRAAARAALAGAHREAAAHLEVALRFLAKAEPETAAELYEQWAYESGLAERIDDAVIEARRHAISLWRALGRPEKVGENLRLLSRMHWYRGEAAEATRLADEAIALLDHVDPSPARGMAYSLRSQLYMLHDRMDEAVRWGELALDLEAQFPNPGLKCHALNNIGTAQVFRGNANGVAKLNESLRIALDHSLHEHAARVYTNLSEYAVDFRDFALAEKMTAEGLAFDTQNDLYAWTHYLSGRQALLRLDQGRLHDAETIARGVQEMDRLTLLMRLPALHVLARARLRLGGEDARDLVKRAYNDALATEEMQNIVPAQITMVEAAWLLNDPNLANEAFAGLLHLNATSRHVWDLGEVAVWAKRFRLNLPEFAGVVWSEPHRLELEGDLPGAAAAWEALGLPYAAAIVRLQSPDGEMLRAACVSLEAIGAEAALEKARELARERGLTAFLPRRRRGAYGTARTHPIGLTKRELEVLKHIVQGDSNKVIAVALKRSIRTIENQVSSILQKANATNRMALLLRVQSEPWLLEQGGA